MIRFSCFTSPLYDSEWNALNSCVILGVVGGGEIDSYSNLYSFLVKMRSLSSVGVFKVIIVSKVLFIQE